MSLYHVCTMLWSSQKFGFTSAVFTEGKETLVLLMQQKVKINAAYAKWFRLVSIWKKKLKQFFLSLTHFDRKLRPIQAIH